MVKISAAQARLLLDEHVAWLNYEGAAAEDFRKLTDLAQSWAREVSARRYKPEQKMAWHRKTHPLCKRITKKYPSDPLMLATGPRYRAAHPGGGGMIYIADVPRVSRLGLASRDSGGWFAMGMFRLILDEGLLLNIGRCKRASCGRYFHGRIGKRFCSDTCARQEIRQSDEYKKKNAADQRKHYKKYFSGRRGKGV